MVAVPFLLIYLLVLVVKDDEELLTYPISFSASPTQRTVMIEKTIFVMAQVLYGFFVDPGPREEDSP